jgi:hypothetical protein
MALTTSQLEDRFAQSLAAFKDAPAFSKKDKRTRLISQLDLLSRSADGIALIHERMPSLEQAGLFQDTVWQDPKRLIPGLVRGTLLSGSPTSTLEVVNELRLLSIQQNQLDLPGFSAEEAEQYLQRVLVATFEMAFEDFEQKGWERYPKGELKKIRLLFDHLKRHMDFEALKPFLLEEIEVIVAHRPIVVTRIKQMLWVLHDSVDLDPTLAVDRKLSYYMNVLYEPSDLAKRYPNVEAYAKALPRLKPKDLLAECQALGKYMVDTGLVSEYQLALLKYVERKQPDLIPEVLSLDTHGQADFERHGDFVRHLIMEFIVSGNKQAVYGLARVLQRNLLSRKTTWHAFNRFVTIKIHPKIAERLEQGNLSSYELTPKQSLMGGTLCALGQPLGVRQGNNPTCQSARGISMWSRHAPGKLINLLIDAATTNNVVFRFEGETIESAGVLEGLTQKFDFKLDPVSIVLVPHLDKVYNEMMKKASLKHFGKDPHSSVNPAFYGHWIQTGFASVYNPTLHAVQDYDRFVRVFYASFHPEYNGGHHLIYPVPTGIFITDASANMLGFHAISLLRVEKDQAGVWRAYFFNPNSQGKQDWGQGIHPTVWGNGERHGESSLPMDQFAARVYAYHYNDLRLGDKYLQVPAAIVSAITKISKESWGRKYRWV